MLVAPYVDMGLLSNGGSLQQLSRASGIKSFTLAFVTAVGCKASWFNAFDPRAVAFRDQVDAIRKQIMAMDYGRAGQDYGDLAIQAAKSTQAQLKRALGIGDAQASRMLGVTPMLGV